MLGAIRTVHELTSLPNGLSSLGVWFTYNISESFLFNNIGITISSERLKVNQCLGGGPKGESGSERGVGSWRGDAGGATGAWCGKQLSGTPGSVGPQGQKGAVGRGRKAFPSERVLMLEVPLSCCWGDVHFKYPCLKSFAFNFVFAYCMSVHLTE